MRNDTEYLLSSPANAEHLMDALREIYAETLKEPIPDKLKELLDKLK